MAKTYDEAQKRALEINVVLKHSSFFARPVRDGETLFGWDIEVVDSKKLMEEEKKNPKFHF
jgi:hypothetical protein